VTGEIKELDRGLLRVRTNAMGTVDIEWKEIERVTSNYSFEIEVSSGGAGLGRNLIQTNRSRLSLVGGSIFSRENLPDDPSVNSV